MSPTCETDHSALYDASRSALEEAKLEDSSLGSIPLARRQAWILIAVYELVQLPSIFIYNFCVGASLFLYLLPQS
jgi:hypothetical protein